MKTYLVYVNGVEQCALIKATSHNKAEEKARKKYFNARPEAVTVAYTEV